MKSTYFRGNCILEELVRHIISFRRKETIFKRLIIIISNKIAVKMSQNWISLQISGFVSFAVSVYNSQTKRFICKYISFLFNIVQCFNNYTHIVMYKMSLKPVVHIQKWLNYQYVVVQYKFVHN